MATMIEILPAIDPTHKYVGTTGSPGLLQFWFMDKKGDYWEYTNAPEGSEDFDELYGPTMMVRDQPFPSSNPEFFSVEGIKLSNGVPEDSESSFNDNMDLAVRSNCWYAQYTKDDVIYYTYYDKLVKEEPTLNFRINHRKTAASVVRLRKYYSNRFKLDSVYDKAISSILALVDQGHFVLEDLLQATVADFRVQDNSVFLLDKALVCSTELFEFLSLLSSNKGQEDPLFSTMTIHGVRPVSYSQVKSILNTLGVQTDFLFVWRVSQAYSSIFDRNKRSFDTYEEVHGATMVELNNSFNTLIEAHYYLDPQVVSYVNLAYTESLAKAVMSVSGVSSVDVSLSRLRESEQVFNDWLFSTPIHEDPVLVEEKISYTLDGALLKGSDGYEYPVLLMQFYLMLHDKERKKLESSLVDAVSKSSNVPLPVVEVAKSCVGDFNNDVFNFYKSILPVPGSVVSLQEYKVFGIITSFGVKFVDSAGNPALLQAFDQEMSEVHMTPGSDTRITKSVANLISNIKF